MIDLYLRFSSRTEAIDVFRTIKMTALVPDDEGGLVERVAGLHGNAVWEVGNIQGRIGWHINLRVLDDAFDIGALEPFRVYPQNPVCVWA